MRISKEVVEKLIIILDDVLKFSDSEYNSWDDDAEDIIDMLIKRSGSDFKRHNYGQWGQHEADKI